MGQKSGTETVVAIIQAFLQKRSWTQAALAEHVGVGVPSLRKRLSELSAGGFPLEREEDHPHVWWSVPKDWFPGGVLFSSDELTELLRQLGRLPRSTSRDRLIRHVVEAAPRQAALPRGGPAPVVAPEVSESEERHLSVVEDAALRRVALSFKYFSASRGAMEWRYASVQRVMVGPHARFLAVCHRDDSLKWFRLDNVQVARLDDSVPFRAADVGSVDAVMAESIDGFHQGSAPVVCSFVVRAPEDRWVLLNLPASMRAEPVAGGHRISTTTAGLLRLARYVVGLGDAVRVETPELAKAVRALAEGALLGLKEGGLESCQG